VASLKAVKNSTEIEGMKQAHVRSFFIPFRFLISSYLSFICKLFSMRRLHVENIKEYPIRKSLS